MSSVSVSKLVKYLKMKLDGDDNLRGLKVTGEISNYHRHFSSGHLYFTLKDERAQIACVMFKSNAQSLKFEPKNGDKVELSASVSIFESSGQLQLYVTSLRLAGLGDLYQRYEELKNRLLKEGYFDESHKKEIPSLYPQKIAVLVGDKSAAMSDIKVCFKRRWPLCSVDYYPVLVQGIDAPKDIIKTLNEVDKMNYEIIILARGGGSFEDLFCFNDEELVKTIFKLNTFIITGIGHEQDFTLADFVADLRAATPTATVELVTPNILDVIKKVEEAKYSLTSIMNQRLLDLNNDLDKLTNNKYLINPKSLIEKTNLRLDYYLSRIASFSQKLNVYDSRIDNTLKDMERSIRHKIELSLNKINSLESLLKVYSIDNTLKRGFSLVYKEDRLIKDKASLNKNDEISVRLYKGNIKAKVQ